MTDDGLDALSDRELGDIAAKEVLGLIRTPAGAWRSNDWERREYGEDLLTWAGAGLVIEAMQEWTYIGEANLNGFVEAMFEQPNPRGRLTGIYRGFDVGLPRAILIAAVRAKRSEGLG